MHARRRLNRVQTNQIGQYTLKINVIILNYSNYPSVEQNVAGGEQNEKNIYLFVFIPIINLSELKRNRSTQNHDASKNRLCFPPLLISVGCV